MVKGKTAKGFEFELDEAVFDDWELVEALADVEAGKITGIMAALKKILGDEGYVAMKEAYRVNGKVSTSDMSVAIKDIMAVVAESKKGKN